MCGIDIISRKIMTDLKDLKRIRDRTTNPIRDAKVTFERNIATNVREEPKSFWKIVRSKTKVRQTIGELKSQDATMTITDEQKADTLNKHYHQVFTKEDDADTTTLEPRYVEDTLTTIVIQKDEVLKKPKSLKISSAASPDNIHPRILTETQLEIAGPLQHMFQLSINEGTLSRDWKGGNITPIFKKGSRTNPANYMPISLTSVVCKMLEGLLRDHLMVHLSNHLLLSDHQYVCRKGRSCTLQLIHVIDNWTKAIDEGDRIDVAYFDSAKAFDTGAPR